jgi:hypothetical protein
MFAPEKVLAAVVTTACVVAFIRLCLGARRRQRFDQVMRRWWLTLKNVPQRLRQRPMSKKEAAMLAQDAIERARQRKLGQKSDGKPPGSWDGNVYRPKSFKGPRKPH